MAYFKNKYQMLKATDDEIRKFFANTIFEGTFSTKIKSNNHADYFKGHIHSIKVNGEPTNVIGSYINVPNVANDIPEGECSFKCRVKDVVRSSPSQVNFTISPKTLRSKSAPKPTLINEVREGELTNEDLFELWGVDDCECIGFYHYDTKSGGYLIDDLRKTNFDHIPPYLTNKKAISLWLKYPQKDIELGNYYRFTWKLSHKNSNNPYEIYLDNRYSPQTITPKWFIDKLFEDRHSDKSKNFGSAANFLDTLSKQLSAKESTFVYELLQNANDYPVEGKMVDVEFHITDNYLLFLHSGDKFNVRNISGICGINEKEKVANRKAIGYKGIGFKTVFLNNHYVYLRTGDYSFRFDQGETPEKKRGGKIKRQDAPFQILPIWTEHNEISTEVNSVFDNADSNFQVKIALRPDNQRILHYGKNSYENLFRDVFSDSNIILFIPNINSVRVFINGHEERACYRKNEEWVIGDYESEEGEISTNLQRRINKTIEKGKSRIPEKYKDFEYTKVSFACKHEGAIIKAVDDANLYCYLPTSTSWGLPFLMNTDMIPKGDRDDIEKDVNLLELNEKEDEVDDYEEKNFNEEIASIAGTKLFFWVRDLLTSRKYELGSVFSLIPNFDKCIKEHKDYKEFITKFKDSFEYVLSKENIVPVKKGIANVNYVVYDTTGLTTSGIMSDEEFFTFSDLEEVYLPLPMLRTNKPFNRFLKNYAKDDLTFTTEDLHTMIGNKAFQEWLKVQENNDRFLNFLLENNLLEDFLDEKIFIEHECGSLYSAGDLYYDIDEHLIDLKAFSNHLCYLSFKTREYFSDNTDWENIVNGKFNSFVPDSFVTDTLLSRKNKLDTIKTLKNENTSLHFYHFLAKNDIYDDEISDLPFFNTQDEVVDDFDDKFIFFPSSIGETICKSDWLSNIDIEFISTKYDSSVTEYFEKNLGVKSYSNEIIAKEIILSDDYCDEVQDAIGEDYDISESFVKFCFKNQTHFTAGTLNKYALNVVDKNGDYCFIIPKDDEVFFSSSLYDSYCEKEWIDNGWMYCLDSDYIKNCSDGKVDEFKKFMDTAFWVGEISAKKFYSFVVKKHIKDINSNISGNNDADGSKNIDFIKYLDENYRLIFEEEKDADQFASVTLISEDNCDISVSCKHVYAFDQELNDILNKEWFPSDIAKICSNKYGNSKALLAIRAEKYDFAGFFANVIAHNIPAINGKITTKDQSIDFHNLVIEHKGQTPTDEQKKMKSAKLYLLGNAEPVNTSTGHAILSSTAKELAENGLVEFSQLNIIDPAYNAEDNRDYWSANLENSDFTITHFLKWLNDNKNAFATTIADEAKNIAFWRWAKKNLSKSAIANLPGLPILLVDDTTAEVNDVIYLADCYINEGGVEGYVRKFDEEANFISAKYVKEDDDIEEWQEFWTAVGLKSEIIDILISTIIPKLDEIDEDTLPATLVKYRSELEDEYEDLPAALTNLRVKAHDGIFYNLKDCIYVNCTEQKEPFAYIEIHNQITFKTGEERALIKQILEKLNVKYIDNTTEWRHAKMNSYLKMQGDLSRRPQFSAIHYAFMDELAELRETSIDALGEYKELEKVLVLDANEEFVDAKELTMSSIYNPFCDFQKNGVTSIKYTSDSYSTNCKNYVGKVMRSLGVHNDFRKGDIEHLTNREFAFYFWTKYLQSKADKDSLDKLADYIKSKEFSETACIPTKDYMRKPSSLYSPAIANYVKKTEDWENKLPLSSIPEIQYNNDKTMFDLLPFKKGLSFSDCLYALFSVQGKDTRPTIVRWAIEDYKAEYESKVDEYREDEGALWTNTKNARVSIKSLYALEQGNTTLSQYFNDLDRILNPEYINIIDFTKACNIFKIKTITDADLIVDPNNAVNSNNLKHRLRISALVIAGLYDIATWKETYSRYDELIEQMSLWRCTTISLQYKDDAEISQSLKKFYYKKETKEFFYVQDIDAKLVFNSFVTAFLEYLGVPTDFNTDIVNEIMDSEQSALGRITNELKLNEEFMNQLDAIIPGKKREMVGVKANDVDELDEIKRHTYTAQPVSSESDSSMLDEKAISSNPETGVPSSQSTTDIASQDDEEDIFDNILNEDDEEDDEKYEALNDKSLDLTPNDFSHLTTVTYSYDGQEFEAVCEHYRSGTYVRGHWRNGFWVNGYWRNGSTVGSHTRTSNHPGWESHDRTNTSVDNEATQQSPESSQYAPRQTDSSEPNNRPFAQKSTYSTPTCPKKEYPTAPRSEDSKRPYTDHTGWNDTRHPYKPSAPKPFSPEDVRNFGSNGQQRMLEILEPSQVEVDAINRLLDGDLSSEQVADQNYLAQYRLYQNLVKKGMTPDESEADFVRNAHLKSEHTLHGGKYIHKCSAAGGIMYISPSIWNKIADDRCVVCVYLGAKANEFMYFNSIEDILNWVREDDIVIKLTGEEKADVVQELYSGILEGVKGTAYTMIRIGSNEKYNSVFAPISQDPNANDNLTDDDI